MDTEVQQEFKPAESDMMDTSSGVTDLGPQKEREEEQEEGRAREEEAPEQTSVNDNDMEYSEPADKGEVTDEEKKPSEEEVKREAGDLDPLEEEEEEEDDREAEEAEEEEDEEELEEERDGEGGEEEEEEEGEMEEGDAAPDEPQDLSLADYTKYESGGAGQPDATAGPAPYAASPSPRGQTAGKLSCDVCGLSCVSLNVLLVHKRSHTGERPFHCSQCGASFTQKGNLLRHIKLHSGEKPFKCPMCSYACRRRDALSGHLRTHSVEKPYKCNHCGRSYKQRSSLEEHRERCHVYIQNKGHAERACEDTKAPRVPMGSERALLLDRLASNVAKRKSSMPQKFTGDNGVCLDLSFSREVIHRADAAMDPPPLASPGPDAYQRQPQRVGSDPDTEPRPYPVPLVLTNGHKLDLLPPGLAPHMGRTGPGHALGLEQLHQADGGGAQRQLHQPLYGLGHLLVAPGLHNGLPHPRAPPHALPPPRAARGGGGGGEEAGGEPGAVYPCTHCRVIFLDYVMFTIHMGCHGFRDPLECNVCGHRSRDRYEFSSHIARGEHRLELK